MNRLRNILEYYSRAMDKAASIAADYDPTREKDKIVCAAKEAFGMQT